MLQVYADCHSLAFKFSPAEGKFVGVGISRFLSTRVADPGGVDLDPDPILK